MTIQSELESTLRAALSPAHLEVVNESFMHAVPKGSETHFRIVVVADAFAGLALLKRHRLVSGVLAPVVGDREKGMRVKAMSFHTFTPVEWEKEKGSERPSPPCAGAH